ncbi:MAG: hypothetical protein ACRCX2_14975 [Paraclostridium sp.]
MEQLNSICSIAKKYGKDVLAFSLLIYLVISYQSRIDTLINNQKSMSDNYITTLDNIRKEDEAKRREDRTYYVEFTIESDKTIRELSNALVNNTHKIELLEREIRELRNDK